MIIIFFASREESVIACYINHCYKTYNLSEFEKGITFAYPIMDSNILEVTVFGKYLPVEVVH